LKIIPWFEPFFNKTAMGILQPWMEKVIRVYHDFLSGDGMIPAKIKILLLRLQTDSRRK
jgi:hypothetical protein